MRPPARGFIGQQEANYIHLLLGHPEPKGKEAALELLCAHYRAGRRLRDPHGICQTLPGLLYHPDPHVRRWTFNAIALVGNKAQNLDATVDALERNRGDDDIFAAGMAALVALTNEKETEARLKQIGVELDGAVLLAAAQQAPSYNDRLAARRVDPEHASPSELRLAAVLVGLKKAPEHLFTLGHENAAVIGSFHSHHDQQVAQYAAWAVCEHPDLNLTHLGFEPSKLRDRQPDVRKYGFRLLTADDATAERYRELIAEAAFDDDKKAREGLAIGLAQGGVNQTATSYVEQAQGHLQSLLDLLDKAGADDKLKEGKQLAAEARAKPTKGMVEKVLGWMTAVKTGSALVVGSAENFTKIGDQLTALLHHLPQG